MLAKANTLMGKPTLTRDLNPKAVRAHELFGYTTPTKETRDGLFSSIMRDMANMKVPRVKRVVGWQPYQCTDNDGHNVAACMPASRWSVRHKAPR